MLFTRVFLIQQKTGSTEFLRVELCVYFILLSDNLFHLKKK